MITEEIGIWLFAIALIIIVIAMTIGHRINQKIMLNLWKTSRDSIKTHASIVGYKKGYKKFKMAFSPKKGSPIEKGEVFILLKDRENFFHYLFKKIQGDYDKFLFQGSLDLKIKRKIKDFNLEVVRPEKRILKRIKRRLASLNRCHELERSNQNLLVRSSNCTIATQTLKNFPEKMKDQLVRLSVGSEDPNIFIIWEIRKVYEVVKEMVDTFFKFSEALEEAF